MMDSYFIVNVVHNDFKNSNAIFEPFFEVAAQYANGNGVANGHAVSANGDHHLKSEKKLVPPLQTISNVATSLVHAAP